jgi:hypothetical protein
MTNNVWFITGAGRGTHRRSDRLAVDKPGGV